MSPHTPLPWRVDVHRGSCRLVGPDGLSTLSVPQGGRRERDEQLANLELAARSIASMPELVRALDLCADRLRTQLSTVSEDEVLEHPSLACDADALQAAVAAIERARKVVQLERS